MKLRLSELKRIIKENLMLESPNTGNSYYNIPRQRVLEAIDYVVEFLDDSKVLYAYSDSNTSDDDVEDMPGWYSTFHGLTKEQLKLLLKEISLMESGRKKADNSIKHNGSGLSGGTNNIFQMDVGSASSIADVNTNNNLGLARKLINDFQKSVLGLDQEPDLGPFQEDPVTFDQDNLDPDYIENPSDDRVQKYSKKYLSPVDVSTTARYGKITTKCDFTRTNRKWQKVSDSVVRGDLYINTLYAALFILVKRFGGSAGDLDSLEGRGEWWKDNYNSESGAGESDEYPNKITDLGIDSGTATPQTNDQS